LFGVTKSLKILLHEPQVIINKPGTKKKGNKWVPLLEEVTNEHLMSFIFEQRSHTRPIAKNNGETESTEFFENVRKIVREFEEVITTIRETKHGSVSKFHAMCQS
jgi:hypothetical protein